MTSPRQSGQSGDGRRYTCPVTGVIYPSVTAVLNVMDKPLGNWIAKLTAEYAYDQRALWQDLGRDAAVALIKEERWRSTNRSAIMGTLVHGAVECYIEGGLLDVDAALELAVRLDADDDKWLRNLAEAQLRDAEVAWRVDDMRPFLAAFQKFLVDWVPVFEYTEATVYCDDYGYAGSLDFLCRLPHLTTGLNVVDIKTGKGVYPEAALQLAGYRFANRIVTGDPMNGKPWESVPMPEIVGGYVLHLRPEGYELYPVECGQEVHDAFVCAAALSTFKSKKMGGLIPKYPLTPYATAPDRASAAEANQPDAGAGADVSITELAAQPSVPASSDNAGTSAPPLSDGTKAAKLPSGWPAVPKPEEDYGTFDVERAALRARMELFPPDFLDRARAGWKRLKFPTLNKPDRWTPGLLVEAERLVAEAEEHITYARGEHLKFCAMAANEMGMSDDTRHDMVSFVTLGSRKGLKECTLVELRLVLAHLNDLKEKAQATA